MAARRGAGGQCPGGSVLTGATLDYGSDLHPPRFRVIRNPNTPVRCACNRSFGPALAGPRHPDCRSRDGMPWDR